MAASASPHWGAWATHLHTSIWTNLQEGGSGSRVRHREDGESMLDKYCMFAGAARDEGSPVASKRAWNLGGIARQAEGSCCGTCECMCVHASR